MHFALELRAASCRAPLCKPRLEALANVVQKRVCRQELRQILGHQPRRDNVETRLLEARRFRHRLDRASQHDCSRRAAFDIVLIERLNTTHPDTDPSRCAWCGKSETPVGTLLRIGVGARHAWLHGLLASWRKRGLKPPSRRWQLWGSAL